MVSALSAGKLSFSTPRRLLGNFLSICSYSRRANAMADVDVVEERAEDPTQRETFTKATTRYNGRVKKRKWEEKPVDEDNQNEESVAKLPCTEPFERIKKKKVVMLLGYSGANYFGMQRNPGMQTIEEEFFKALLKTKYITSEAFSQIQNISFQRAARTDRGVSAVRQVVSLKMPNEVNIPEINQNLPPEIRVFSMKRVTKGFNSKSQCDARTYTYTMPTYTLESSHTDLEDYKTYRISSDKISELNEILKEYEGSKNYHNFTAKKLYIDPSCRRYMISLECGSPFVSEGMEFVTIKIKGQSFMLHQIRKMVGLSIAIVRGITTKEVIQKCFSADDIDIPTAPGLGLVLDQVHYDRYNTRYGNDGIHEPLLWDEISGELDSFKEQYIYPTIVSTEVKDLPMVEWLEKLRFFKFQKREPDEKMSENSNNKESTGEESEDVKNTSDDEVVQNKETAN